MSRVYLGSNDPLTNDEKTDLALYDAILGGHIDEVQRIFQHSKRDLNHDFLVVRNEDHLYFNPMSWASKVGAANILKLLIDIGCNVNNRSIIFKRTAVHIAVLNNNMSCLQLLIAAQAKLDFLDVFGNSACHYAAESGYIDMLDVMIRIGTQVNCQDVAAKTPLMKAVRSNKVDSVTRLIRANADLNILDNNNEIALHFAARNGNAQLVDILLSSGSLVNVQNKWGQSPLITAVFYNQKRVIRLLLAGGSDINIRELEFDETALHIALRKKYTQVVEALLKFILSSIAHTANMLTADDTDINKYFYLLQKEAGLQRMLFHVAADKCCYETCHLLASLGFIDYSLYPRFLAHLENQSLSESDQEHLLSVLKCFSTPLTLKCICRNIIRYSIGQDLSKAVSCLPIPSSLQDFLLFKTENEISAFMIRN